MLYLTAAYTGLRAGELASLSESQLHLQDAMPVARVEAAYSKRRRRDFQPLRADLVEEFQHWLAAKRKERPEPTEWHERPGSARGCCPFCGLRGNGITEHRAAQDGWLIRTSSGVKRVSGEPILKREAVKLWPQTWYRVAAEMLRKDLAAARQAWIDEQPSSRQNVHAASNRTFCRIGMTGARCATSTRCGIRSSRT